jgi:hypothetical protein
MSTLRNLYCPIKPRRAINESACPVFLLKNNPGVKRHQDITKLRSVDDTALAGQGRWQAIERRLGFALPADYQKLIDAYGGSIWGDVETGEQISILSPFARTPDLNLCKFGVDMLSGYQATFLPADLERLPFTYAMEPGGLVPWLITSAGHIAYLLVRGDPVPGYPIVFQMSRAARFEITCDLTCSEFAYRVASRTLQSGILPPWPRVRETRAGNQESGGVQILTE